MAVTAKQLREGAQEAQVDGPEVERRVAVSRTYYAAFHRCRPIAQRQGTFADAAGSHAEVIEALTRSRKRKLQSIGYMLKLCRELRVKADYRIEDDLTIQDAEAAKSHSDRIWAAAEAEALDQTPAP